MNHQLVAATDPTRAASRESRAARPPRAASRASSSHGAVAFDARGFRPPAGPTRSACLARGRQAHSPSGGFSRHVPKRNSPLVVIAGGTSERGRDLARHHVDAAPVRRAAARPRCRLRRRPAPAAPRPCSTRHGATQRITMPGRAQRDDRRAARIQVAQMRAEFVVSDIGLERGLASHAPAQPGYSDLDAPRGLERARDPESTIATVATSVTLAIFPPARRAARNTATPSDRLRRAARCADCAIVARSTYSARSASPSSPSTRRTLSKLRPSFMMTAASASARRRLSSSSGNTPDSTDRLWLRYTSGAPSTAAPPSIEHTPGTTSASKRAASRSCRYMYEP